MHVCMFMLKSLGIVLFLLVGWLIG